MPDLVIQLTKGVDGGAVLRCIRADGSTTWQRQEGPSAAFFPLHDLTHYAIETELGFASGFYGLVAAGWDIRDTEGKGPRGPLPGEALTVEHLAGMFDLERAGSVVWEAAQLNEEAARYAREGGREPPRRLTDADLERLRTRLGELFARWAVVPAGLTMELTFHATRTEPPRTLPAGRSSK